MIDWRGLVRSRSSSQALTIFVKLSFLGVYRGPEYLFELIGSLKSPKLTCSGIYPGNKKQNVSLDLVIFHETTIAAIMGYIPVTFDAANLYHYFMKFL